MKNIQRYFEEEKAWLFEAGKQFAEANPGLRTFLRADGAELGDPHVDRILEALAFLAARIEHRLDNSLMNLADDLLEVCYPGLLEPQPALGLVRYTAKPTLSSLREIPAGANLATRRGAGVGRAITIRATDRVEVTQLQVVRLQADDADLGDSTRVRLGFAMGSDEPVGKPEDLPGRLPILPFWPNLIDACHFYSAFRRATVPPLLYAISPSGGRTVASMSPVVRLVHPSNYPPMLSGNDRQFPGLRMLREFLALPQRFMAFEILGLDRCLELEGAASFELELRLPVSQRSLPRLAPSNFLLHVSGASNDWSSSSKSINYDGSQARHTLQVDRRGGGEIIRVNSVRALKQGSKNYTELQPFDYFEREAASYLVAREKVQYTSEHATTRWQLELAGLDTREGRQRVVAELTCCDHDGDRLLESATQLDPLEGMPTDVKGEVLGTPSRFARAMDNESEYWQLVDLLSSQLMSLGEVRQMRRFLTHLNRSKSLLANSAIHAIEDVEVRATFETLNHEPVKMFHVNFTVADAQTTPVPLWDLFFNVFRVYLTDRLPLNTRLWLKIYLSGQKEPVLEWKPSQSERQSRSSAN